MLHRMPMRLFREWQAYHDLAPFGDDRRDIRVAAIERALHNILLRGNGKTPPEGWPWALTDFILRFGDSPDYAKAAKAKQEEILPTWKKNKALLFAIAHAWADDPKGTKPVPEKNKVGTHGRKLGE